MYSRREGFIVLQKIVIGLDMEAVKRATREASSITAHTSEELLNQCIEHCLRGGDFDRTLIGICLMEMGVEGK